jgi:D-alanyl-D-alanine carboxypeptidase
MNLNLKKLKIILCIPVCFMLFALTQGACGTAAPPIPTGSFSENEVARITADFQATLDRAYKIAQSADEIFPGATAAFILPDDQAVGIAVGFSDVEKQIPMTAEMRMPSGSIGKTYVAPVAISLAQEGKLNLDDRIEKWLGDEDWFERLPNGKDITLRMLLNHSSGLIDHVFDSEEFAKGTAEAAQTKDSEYYFTPRQLVEFILDKEPLFPAGKSYSYTDTGYILAGMVIEKAGGSTYYDELRKRILEPLGFRYTIPQDTRSVPDLAQGYAHASAELFGLPVKIVEGGSLLFNPMTEWTGGGLYNNPKDLVRWAKLAYEGRALKEPYLDEILSSAIDTDPEGSKAKYGLGISIVDTELGRVYGHSGFFPGYNSRMAYFPDDGVALAMQINTDRSNIQAHFDPLAKVVLDAVRNKH